MTDYTATAPVRPPTVDEEPAAVCPRCDRPFATERLYHLHLGDRHAGELDEDERALTEAAHDEERDDLWVYHLKITAAITFLTFGFVYTYATVWT